MQPNRRPKPERQRQDHLLTPLQVLGAPFALQNRAKRVNGALGIPIGRIPDSAILSGATVFEIMNAAEKVAPDRQRVTGEGAVMALGHWLHRMTRPALLLCSLQV